jgi:hypothetical protein
LIFAENVLYKCYTMNNTLRPAPDREHIFSGSFRGTVKRGVNSTREQWQRKLVVVRRRVRPA